MTTILNDEQIKQILQGIVIPPQPQIMVDLQMEQMHPEPEIDRIAELIRQDVGLAGTMLKIVNSPLYGLSNTIQSVHQAVMLLGLNTVTNIVNGLSIKGELNDREIVELNRFWDTAMDIAIVSASIAKQVGYANPEEAYNLGLFHNVGIPLMHKRFDNYFSVLEHAYTGQHARIIDTENEAFKTNHAVVGYYCARSWNQPAHLASVIADHHNVQHLFERSAQSTTQGNSLVLVAILKMAEHMCGNYAVLGKQERDHEWESISDLVLDTLGLNAYEMDTMKVIFDERGINMRYCY
ncbi:MAG: HDOD domain-containing protein [Natronospirillum sp.]